MSPFHVIHLMIVDPRVGSFLLFCFSCLYIASIFPDFVALKGFVLEFIPMWPFYGFFLLSPARCSLWPHTSLYQSRFSRDRSRLAVHFSVCKRETKRMIAAVAVVVWRHWVNAAYDEGVVENAGPKPINSCHQSDTPIYQYNRIGHRTRVTSSIQRLKQRYRTWERTSLVRHRSTIE
jgi:hypothetical protein